MYADLSDDGGVAILDSDSDNEDDDVAFFELDGVHLPLFNVVFPENVIEYLKGLNPLMTYDIFFTNEWWPGDQLEYDSNIDPAFH